MGMLGNFGERRNSSVFGSRSALLAIVSVAFWACSVSAADRYWSGTGTWDTTAQNWGTTSGGPYDAAVWNNATPDSATFQGTAGTVTVAAGGVTAGGLSFTTAGYTLAGGTITLSGTPTMTFSNVAATLNARIQLDADADLTITNASTTRLVALGGGIAGTNRNLTIDVTGSNAAFSGIQPTAAWDFTGSVTVNRSAATGYSAIFANQTGGQNALRGADVTLNDALLFMGNGNSGLQVQVRTLAGNSGADIRSDNQSSVLVLGTDDSSGKTTTYSGLLRNGGGGSARVTITKNGTYTQVFDGAGITYTGATTINAGTLRLNATTAFASAVVFANAAGATLELGSALALPGLSGGGATGGTVALGSHTLTVNKTSGADTFSGVMSGTGSLVKAGAGGLTLSGVSVGAHNRPVIGA
jgi:fibronectin-binding autotransporter adhesin